MPDSCMPDHLVEQLRADVHRLEHENAELRRQLRINHDQAEQINRAFALAASENYQIGLRLARYEGGASRA